MGEENDDVPIWKKMFVPSDVWNSSCRDLQMTDEQKADVRQHFSEKKTSWNARSMPDAEPINPKTPCPDAKLSEELVDVVREFFKKDPDAYMMYIAQLLRFKGLGMTDQQLLDMTVGNAMDGLDNETVLLMSGSIQTELEVREVIKQEMGMKHMPIGLKGYVRWMASYNEKVTATEARICLVRHQAMVNIMTKMRTEFGDKAFLRFYELMALVYHRTNMKDDPLSHESIETQFDWLIEYETTCSYSGTALYHLMVKWWMDFSILPDTRPTDGVALLKGDALAMAMTDPTVAYLLGHLRTFLDKIKEAIYPRIEGLIRQRIITVDKILSVWEQAGKVLEVFFTMMQGIAKKYMDGNDQLACVEFAKEFAQKYAPEWKEHNVGYQRDSIEKAMTAQKKTRSEITAAQSAAAREAENRFIHLWLIIGGNMNAQNFIVRTQKRPDLRNEDNMHKRSFLMALGIGQVQPALQIIVAVSRVSCGKDDIATYLHENWVVMQSLYLLSEHLRKGGAPDAPEEVIARPIEPKDKDKEKTNVNYQSILESIKAVRTWSEADRTINISKAVCIAALLIELSVFDKVFAQMNYKNYLRKANARVQEAQTRLVQLRKEESAAAMAAAKAKSSSSSSPAAKQE